MSIRVGELVSNLRTRSQVVTTNLGSVELLAEGDGAGVLRVGDVKIPWGSRNTQMVVGFINGPGYKYVDRQSLGWQRKIVEHHIDENKDTPSIWYIEGNNIAGIYHEGSKIIPLVDVAEQIADVFDPLRDYANVLYSPDQVEINVTSNVKTVTVPGVLGDPSRPLVFESDELDDDIKVGDISAGGVRIIMQPAKPERAPIVEEFWERFVCTNGMTRRTTKSQINLRGRTVEQILTEMNRIMRTIWEGLEGSAQNILHSAETPVPGAISDFIRVVARERNINAATILRLQERAASLRPDPSVYDVTQIITEMANEDGLPVLTRRNLQAIGGDLTIDTDRMTHRCSRCEKPLISV